MIIDFHTHAWPEKVSDRARRHLEGLFGVKMVGDPTVSTLRRFMKKNRIDVSVVCGVAVRPEQVGSINQWMFGIRSKDLRVFAAMHPEFEDWEKELIRIREHADGIKF